MGLSATGVRLEQPSLAREREVIAAAQRSRALHRGLVTAPSTPDEFAAFVSRAQRADQSSFLVVARAGEVVGVVELLDVVRGPDSSARLAYYAFVPHAGRGYLREAVALALEHAFGELALGCVVAEIQPGNGRSIALVERLGFARASGAAARRKVGTRWREHERWLLRRGAWSARTHDDLARA